MVFLKILFVTLTFVDICNTAYITFLPVEYDPYVYILVSFFLCLLFQSAFSRIIDKHVVQIPTI